MIYCENIVIVTLFFLLSPDFGTTFFPPPIFGNAITTIVTNFFFPISTIALPQLVCQKFFFFFSLRALHAFTPRQQNWAQEIRYPHCRNSTFSLSTFFFFSLILWLNFGNDNTENQSLSSESQISFNNSYNAN